MKAIEAQDPGKRARKRRFLALPGSAADGLRAALVALAAYLVTIEAVYLLGYQLPLLQRLPPELAVIAPFLLLVLGSAAAVFIRRRLGFVFTAVWVLLLAVALLAPAQ